MAKRLTKAALIKAIKDSKGIKTEIARRLKCNRRTVSRWIERSPEVRAAYEDEEEDLLDELENRAYDLAMNGDDPRTLHFLLAVKGKGRGYGKQGDTVTVDAGGTRVEVVIGGRDE